MNKGFLRTVLIQLGFLFWCRLLFFISFIRLIDKNLSSADWLNFLFASFRFDAMVVGYTQSLFLILTIPGLFINGWKKYLPGLYQFILFLYFIIIAVISILDLQHFRIFHDRFLFQNISAMGNWNYIFDWHFYLSSALFIFFSFRAILKTIKLDLPETLELSWLSWLGCVFLTVIMIRSSFGEHHLDLRNAEVTPSSILNRLSINSAYALDQALRQRR